MVFGILVHARAIHAQLCKRKKKIWLTLNHEYRPIAKWTQCQRCTSPRRRGEKVRRTLDRRQVFVNHCLTKFRHPMRHDRYTAHSIPNHTFAWENSFFRICIALKDRVYHHLSIYRDEKSRELILRCSSSAKKARHCIRSGNCKVHNTPHTAKFVGA